MIQETVTRARHVEGVGAPLVVCNEAQAGQVIDQLVAVGAHPRAVLVEPEGRNTAPAVAAAALSLDPTEVMAVFPADHVIADTVALGRALLQAVEAAGSGSLVVFGVVPTRPDTGFGYIEVDSLADGVGLLRRFVEKPDQSTAERYLASGYLWNSGMFVFTAGAILDELRRHAPEVVTAAWRALEVGRADSDGVTMRLGDDFTDSPSVSIDYAVMEKTTRGAVVLLDAGWTDVGTWQALWETVSPLGKTAVHGRVYVEDVERSYIRAESRPVAVVGLEDVIVVETDDGVLVMDRRRAQDVRSVAEWFAGLHSPGSSPDLPEEP